MFVACRKELTCDETLDPGAGAPGLCSCLSSWVLLCSAGGRGKGKLHIGFERCRTAASSLARGHTWSYVCVAESSRKRWWCKRSLFKHTQGLHCLWWEGEGQEVSQAQTMTLGGKCLSATVGLHYSLCCFSVLAVNTKGSELWHPAVMSQQHHLKQRKSSGCLSCDWFLWLPVEKGNVFSPGAG